MSNQKDVNVATASIRRVIRIGGSHAITIPRAWADGRIGPGDEVALIADKELRIVLIHDIPGKAGEVSAEGDA